MRYVSMYAICFVISVTIAACGPPLLSGREPAIFVATVTALSSFSPLAASSTPIARPSMLATTTMPSMPVVTAWSTYIDPSGVSLEYPTDWEIMRAGEFLTGFRAATNGVYNDSVGVSITKVPLTQRAQFNPYTIELDKNGYAIYWTTSITVPKAEGLLYVVGIENFNQQMGVGLWQATPLLSARYHSKAYEIGVSLYQSFDDESTIMAQTVGLAETVAQRHSVFDHMLKSVRFPAPPAEGQ